MKNCVYRFVNENNEIIYIGKAKDLRNRINTHNHLPQECYEERIKIEYTSFKTETDMDFAERYYILTLNPKYNTVLANKKINITCSELDVKEWSEYFDGEEEFNLEYIKMYETILSLKDMSSTKKVLLCLIISVDEERECVLSNKKIAETIGMKKTVASKTLNELMQEGYIKIEYEQGARSLRPTNKTINLITRE